MRTWLALAAALVLTSAGADAAEKTINLFNGKDFTGWTFFLEEKDYNEGGKGKISDFASVKPGGVIQLDPKLHGALMTQKDYQNYRLQLEWRWVDPKGRNNTGIFLRTRPPFVWNNNEQARFYMIQVQPPNTGDLWVLGGYSETMLVTKNANIPFGEGKGHRRQHPKFENAEKPAGEWNEMDVTIDGKTIKVYVNGVLVNEGSNLATLPGRVGLESEFGSVQFRNIRLTPLN